MKKNPIFKAKLTPLNFEFEFEIGSQNLKMKYGTKKIQTIYLNNKFRGTSLCNSNMTTSYDGITCAAPPDELTKKYGECEGLYNFFFGRTFFFTNINRLVALFGFLKSYSR